MTYSMAESEELYAFVKALTSKYGYRDVHLMMLKIMRDDYEYLLEVFPGGSVAPPQAPPAPETTRVIPLAVKEKKTRKPRTKKSKAVESTASPLEPVNEMVKEVVVTDAAFRDPKEVKEFQRSQEEKKAQENKAAGIDPMQVLTKANLKKWIEEEGRTYAWVAREKAGCPDTQVAATAQMMGIRSKISKKRSMIMSGH